MSFPLRARYFDGLTPRAREVEVEITSEALIYRAAGEVEIIGAWPREQLRRDLSSPHVPLLSKVGESDARIEFSVGFVELEALLPELRAQRPRIFESVSRPWVIGGTALVLMVSGLLLSLDVIVNQIARHVSSEWEQKHLGHLGDDPLFAYCRLDPKAERAVQKILARIYPVYPGDATLRLKLGVVDLPIANAFALPGGKMVFTQGMVTKAANPSWLVDVLAHEISHVELHHVTAQLIELAVLESVLAMVQGGKSTQSGVGIFSGLIASRFSQRAERAADERGVERLHRAGLNARGLALFLEQADMDVPKFLRHFSSHPEKQERLRYLKTLEAQKPGLPDFRLPESEWKALKAGCLKSPKP